jgi:hypothetical protein
MTDIRHYRAVNLNYPDLLSHLKAWFVNQDFEVQALKTEDGADLLQVAKKGTWRKFVGLSTALNVVVRSTESDLAVEVGAGRWIDKAAAGTVSLFVLWPLAVTAAFGAWQQMKMPEKTFSEVDSFLGLPRNVTIYFDAELERVPAAEEKVQVPHGVTASVKRSRTIEHSVNLTTTSSVESSTTQTYTEFLCHTVKEKFEQQHGRGYQESETLEYEVRLDGNQSGSYTLTWVDSYCTGTIEFTHADKIDRRPFRFRTKTELQVTPAAA